MRILQITAGAANMYCGSCLRDNALAAELIAQGHKVTLVPLYTPTLTDETNVSSGRVFFGGISVYLQQKSSLFRKTPKFLDRLWDSKTALRAATSGSIQTNPADLGGLTVGMLTGEDGNLKKEFGKFLTWAASEPKPDVVVLPYTLLIGLAAPIKRVLGCPIVCALQGEDLFLEGLAEPWRTDSLRLIRSQVQHVDLFAPVSDFYARLMSSYLSIPRTRMEVLPLGISTKGLDAKEPKLPSGPLKFGYMARVAPEKGLHVLAEAFRIVRQERSDVVLEAAGYMAPEQKGYLAECRKIADFPYHGTLDREQKIEFLKRVDVVCVPSPYAEPKGLYLLEAMAVGTPFLQPAHGAFPEIEAKTGGGLLAESAEPQDVARGIRTLAANRSLIPELSRKAAEGVRREYSIERSARRAVEIYSKVLGHSRAAEVAS